MSPFALFLSLSVFFSSKQIASLYLMLHKLSEYMNLSMTKGTYVDEFMV